MNTIFTYCLAGAAFALIICFSQTIFGSPKPGSWRGQSVTEFAPQENEKFAWQVVNDGVMGGLSKGQITITDAGTMKFAGDLSLENNGGFSTVRSSNVDLNLSNDLGLLLLVKGDGRTFEARLATEERFRRMEVSFSGKFQTTKGKWQQVKIPFSDFNASFRGTELPDRRLNPAKIKRIGILLGDKQNGPFNLEIDWIRTYGKGQGNFTNQGKASANSETTALSDGSQDLIATAVADGRFTILKKALDTAGLTTFFQWDNKLTVFAPTDEAFAKLPKVLLDDLLKPENKEKLVSILSYHVTPGSTDLSDVLKSKEVKTIQGAPLRFAFSKGRIRVNNSTVIDGDLKCSDGIIHVIDTVLLPPEISVAKGK